MNTPPVCDYEGSDYQERFWGGGKRDYEDAAEVMALKKVLPASGKHLLEVGAGAGRNTPRYVGFEKVTLLDYSTSQLKLAIEKLGEEPRYRYIAADIYRWPLGPSSFDAVTMIRTLHHLSQPEIALKNIYGSLADGATFILEFANKRNYKAMLRYMVGKQTENPYDHESVEFAELNYHFHPATVKSLVRGSGFKIEQQLGVSFLRSDFIKSHLSQKVLVGLESFFQQTASWTAYSPSIFLKTKVDKENAPLNPTAIFRCPACGHFPVEDTPPELACDACGRTYTVKGGIYDFRLKPE